MKKFVTVLLALTLAACVPAISAVSTVAGIISNPAVTHTANKVTIEGTRALILAHNAYQGTAALATAAIKSGRLSDDTVRKIVVLNDQAIAILEGGGSALTATEKATALFGLSDNINRLLGR